MASVIEPDDIDWNRYLVESDAKAKVRPASAYVDELQAYFAGSGDAMVGDLLPWMKAQDDVRLRPGEVSVWAGYNGQGKSLLLGFVILGLMRQRRRCLIASFEMKPGRTLNRMCRQASQGTNPSAEFIDQFAHWTDDRLWLYDHQGMVGLDRMLAVCRYAHDQLGMHHIVIDSLMKCVRGEDDYNGQKDFIDALTAIARDTDMHIHIVHHMRKGAKESDVPGKFDLKGSGSIADQVDNLFVVWRNKGKEQDLQEGKEVEELDPDSVLICDKQRNGEWEGRLKLWFHKPSMQYVEQPGQRAQMFVAPSRLTLA